MNIDRYILITWLLCLTLCATVWAGIFLITYKAVTS